MSIDFPNNSDGAVLRMLAARGSNLSKAMMIDFSVTVPDHDKGMAFAALVESMGFKTDVWQDEASGVWTCECSRLMVPDYDEIIAIQQSLEELGRPFDARPDGWGSFGNAAPSNRDAPEAAS